MNKTELQNIMKYLKELGKGKIEPYDNVVGICYSLQEKFPHIHEKEVSTLVAELSLFWPRYSGNPVYPIADPAGVYTPREYFYCKGNLWVGQPGKLRKELCLFMADEIKKKLIEQNIFIRLFQKLKSSCKIF